MATPLKSRSIDELQGILAHTDEVYRELASQLEGDPTLAEAVRVLIQSDTTTEDFVVLLTAQPNVGQKLLESSLSALVNVHSRVAVQVELDRRTDSHAP